MIPTHASFCESMAAVKIIAWLLPCAWLLGACGGDVPMECRSDSECKADEVCETGSLGGTYCVVEELICEDSSDCGADRDCAARDSVQADPKRTCQLRYCASNSECKQGQRCGSGSLLGDVCVLTKDAGTGSGSEADVDAGADE